MPNTPCILSVCLAVLLTGQGASADEFAWQQTSPYVAPDFETYFPDDKEGGEKLDQLWRSRHKDEVEDEEILSTVRNGLRHTTQHRTSILRWVGNKYIWNRSPQNPEAIEIMYHAADFSGERADPYGTRHYAVYFGLSVVQEKSPAILKTLVALCMRVDDPNDLSRVAWGARSQRVELLDYLQPYLQSEDAATVEKAGVCEKIFKGELQAFAWAAAQAKKKAEEEFSDRLPEIRMTLSKGDSEERLTTLHLIMRHRLALIMEDDFLPAFESCAEDPDSRVRKLVATVVGSRWIWEAKEQNATAVELMMSLSRDEDRSTRYNAVYFGLSTVRKKSLAVVRRLIELAVNDLNSDLLGRVQWSLRQDHETAEPILDELLQSAPVDASERAKAAYQFILGKSVKE